jgi:hypothetical protein
MKKPFLMALSMPLAAGLLFAQSSTGTQTPGSSSDPQLTGNTPQHESTGSTTDRNTSGAREGTSNVTGGSQKWRGTLVDANCNFKGGPSSHTQSSGMDQRSGSFTGEASAMHTGATGGHSGAGTDPAGDRNTSARADSTSATDPVDNRSGSRIGEASRMNEAAGTGTDTSQQPYDQSADRMKGADHSTTSGSARDREMHRGMPRKLDRSCAITSSTTEFAMILPGGRLVKLDTASNTMVSDQIRNNSEWRGDMDASQRGRLVRATVTGSVEGDRLKVESFQRR